MKDEEVGFRCREYLEFDAVLKKIRLSEPLSALLARKEVYMSRKIPRECFEALRCIKEVLLVVLLNRLKLTLHVARSSASIDWQLRKSSEPSPLVICCWHSRESMVHR